MNIDLVLPRLSGVAPLARKLVAVPVVVIEVDEEQWDLADRWSDAQDAAEASAKIKADADAKAAAIAKAAADEAAAIKAANDLKAEAAARAAASVVQCSHKDCRTRMVPERALWRGEKPFCVPHSVRSDIPWTLKQRQEAQAASFRASQAEATARAKSEKDRREAAAAERQNAEFIKNLLRRR